MLLTGAEIILECLLEQGVDTVFGYPGGAVLNIYDALYEYSHSVKHVITCHEQAACHAADGYSRATGRVGVVIATSGPGATNLVTGLAAAYMDSVPMVAITGNVATSLLGLDSFQEVDITGITMPITKHNYIVKDIASLAGVVREAFEIANSGRKGPVLIDVPKDITGFKADFEKKTPFKTEAVERMSQGTVKSDSMDLELELGRALEMLQSSTKPFIYAGGGVVSCNGAESLKAFADRLDAPVALSLMGQCAMDNSNPRFIGMLGMHGSQAAAKTISECDLLIVLGARFSDRVTCNTGTFAQGIRVLHVDIDPAEINKNISANCEVCGDVRYILDRFLERMPQQTHQIWMREVAEWQKLDLTPQRSGIEELDNNPETVFPQAVLETLNRLTEGEAILSTEVGQHQMWTAQYYKFKTPRSFLSSGGLGAMGYGLGASIGAKCGCPERTVVNVAGDGSFFMNLNELATLSRFKIGVIELLFDNNVLGMVRQWQRLFYEGRFSQTTLDRGVDYEKLAEAFGVAFVRIEKHSDIEPGLKRALELSKEGPVLVDCLINKDINVLPMVPAGGHVGQQILEMPY